MSEERNDAVEKFAKHIEVVNYRDDQKLIIDGETFPWLLSEEGPIVHISGRRDFSKVTITLVAESVSVIDSMDPKPADDEDAEPETTSDDEIRTWQTEESVDECAEDAPDSEQGRVIGRIVVDSSGLDRAAARLEKAAEGINQSFDSAEFDLAVRRVTRRTDGGSTRAWRP